MHREQRAALLFGESQSRTKGEVRRGFPDLLRPHPRVLSTRPDRPPRPTNCRGAHTAPPLLVSCILCLDRKDWCRPLDQCLLSLSEEPDRWGDDSHEFLWSVFVCSTPRVPYSVRPLNSPFLGSRVLEPQTPRSQSISHLRSGLVLLDIFT